MGVSVQPFPYHTWLHWFWAVPFCVVEISIEKHHKIAFLVLGLRNLRQNKRGNYY